PLGSGGGGPPPPPRAAPRGRPAEGRVAHADLALKQVAGEKGDDNRPLRRAGRAEQAGDLVDLDTPPWSRGHGLRCEYELGQQHNRIVPERPGALPAPPGGGR